MLKRIFDIVLSLIGLILLCPFFLATAIFMKLDSKGPVFFRQIRIGKNGRPFPMLKFRTMMEAKHWTGPPLSPKNDPRVTDLGAILRRFKINELPQLIKDPKQYYLNHILHEKLKIDLEYVDSRSFLKDVGYLVRGALITITGAVARRHFFENAQQIALFFCDTFICAFSYFLAYFLRMEGELPPVEKTILLHTLPYVIIARMFTFTSFGLYGTLIRYMSFDEVIKLVKAVTFSSVLIIVLTFLIGERAHPRSVFAIDWFVLICLLGGYRLTVKSLKGNLNPNNNGPQKNILIYGAEGMGDLALRYLRMEGEGNVVAFIDDDPRKKRKRFQGVKVLGSRYDIESLVRLYHIDQVLIARRDMPSGDLEHIKSLCEKANVGCEIFALAN